jgi:hypothetical protein
MAAPFRTILSWLAEEHDRVLVHGGAVANECGGVLFAGRGGAGKSTTALLCWHAGWHYLGDDYCLVQPGPATRVFSIYNSAKLTRSAVEKLGRPIASAQIGIGAEKEMLFVSERVARSATCRVIFLPRVAGERQTTIENASAAEALRALAPSSIFQLSGAGAVSFRRLSQFVREVPARRLNLGTDLAQIPPAIAECVANL